MDTEVPTECVNIPWAETDYVGVDSAMKRIPVDEVDARLKEKNLERLEPYKNSYTQLRCRCTICGEIATPRLHDISQGHGGCWSCSYQNRRGSGNGRWRGNDISYGGAHIRVRKTRGSASKFLCVDCGGRAEDWAYSGGSSSELVALDHNGCRYSPDPDDYAPKCKVCHRRGDLALRKAGS